VLDRCIDESLNGGEIDYRIEDPSDVIARKPENCAVEEDILAFSQFLMKSGPDLEQGRQASA
jgi:hypothetical protein